MKSITVLTGVYKRQSVFRLYAMNMTQLKPRPHVIVAGDPGDPCEAIAKEFGLQYLYVPNRPLGKKHNDLVELACKCYPSEYFLFMGMDNLISQSMWDYYVQYRGTHLALLDYWFHNLYNKQTIYWAGYLKPRKYEPIGAGKLVHIDALRVVDFRPFIDSGGPNESDFHRKMLNNYVPMDLRYTDKIGGMSIDLKTPENLTRWKVWNNARLEPYEEIIKRAPDIDELIQSWKK